MHYVYYLTSAHAPSKRYIGCTENLRGRLLDHNSGATRSIADLAPWQLKGYTAFDSKPKALAFERYLKSGSGHAFANKRLW